MTTEAIAQKSASEFGFSMQKDRTYSPRRLFDLGLAEQTTSAGKLCYHLSPLGAKLRNAASVDASAFADLMHYLHYTGYDSAPSTRKFLWSYRLCAQIVWAEQRLVAAADMAARVQDAMKEEFPYLDYSARVGARFDSTAAGRCYAWMKQLSPSPFTDTDGSLQKRIVDRHELAVLALDHVYRTGGYRYGSPVVLSDGLLDQIARVFFLDEQCCRRLITLATRMTRVVKLSDTFSGTSVTLLSPYSIENI